MNRKWLAVVTCCVLILGLSPALQIGGHAQTPAQSPSSGAEQAEWVAEEIVGIPFTLPLGPDAEAGVPFSEGAVPFLEPIPGDAVFIYGPGADMDFDFTGPNFTAALPFPDPDPQEGPPTGPVIFDRHIEFVGPDSQDTITFVGFEAGLGNQVVTGAPYSAQVTSEFQQTLGDGNKIERKTTTTVYRDGQGRTRREQTLPAIGPYSASAEAPQVIFINDPVAGVSYVLDPARKIARKRKMTRPNIQPAIGPGPVGPPPAANPPRPVPGRPLRGIAQRPNAGGRDANVTSESLGNQNIEGILVQGTRVIRAIPAGTVGNQQPIRIASERWYSPELKLNLLVKNTDPMRGLNSTSLTSIRRDEPAASLFQVPADYTVQERNPRGPRLREGPRGMAPPPPPQQ